MKKLTLTMAALAMFMVSGSHAAPAPDKSSKMYAAGAFLSHYGRNAIANKKFCQTLGVDISVFTDKVKKMNQPAYAMASFEMKRKGTSIRQMYKLLEAAVYEDAKQEINEIQKILIERGDDAPTLVDACELYNELASNTDFMERLKFSNQSPKLYKNLVNN